eukprot:s4946_g3.t1
MLREVERGRSERKSACGEKKGSLCHPARIEMLRKYMVGGSVITPAPALQEQVKSIGILMLRGAACHRTLKVQHTQYFSTWVQDTGFVGLYVVEYMIIGYLDP